MSAVLKLQNSSWNSSNCCFISVCPIILTADPLNQSIWIIFYPAATAPKRRVILYSGTWRLKSLLQLEVLDFLTHPPAEQSTSTKTFWCACSFSIPSWVVKYSNSQGRSICWETGEECFSTELMFVNIAAWIQPVSSLNLEIWTKMLLIKYGKTTGLF